MLSHALTLLTISCIDLVASYSVQIIDKDGSNSNGELWEQLNERQHLLIFLKEPSFIQIRNLSENVLYPPTGPSVKDDDTKDEQVDPVSVMWYLGAFGGLIAFFLVVTCSEWCCGGRRPYGSRFADDAYSNQTCSRKPVTPPPPYHLFAPPPYCDIIKDKDGVFVVPVHPPAPTVPPPTLS